jgi:hypothetical protein
MHFMMFAIRDNKVQLVGTKSKCVFFEERNSDRFVKLPPDIIIRGID